MCTHTESISLEERVDLYPEEEEVYLLLEIVYREFKNTEPNKNRSSALAELRQIQFERDCFTVGHCNTDVY